MEINESWRCSPTACGCATKEDCPNKPPHFDANWNFKTGLMRENAVEATERTIVLLERYSQFLEQKGYIDSDWRTEAPYAIDDFLKTAYK